jgi:RNA polymerase sigma-70 factor (ECF subfamily)
MEVAERRALNEAMARLADGDRSAFPPVFEILWPFLLGFTQRIVRNPVDAEDAAQHSLLKVFEHASRFDPSRDAAAWALAIAANECRALRRRRSRMDPLPQGGIDAPAPGASPEAAAIEGDLLALATETLGALRSEDVETLTAAWNERRPAVPATTFRKRVQRATERLRAAWRSRHGTY